jgi:parallel beta-helix repeat protein
MDLTPLPWRRLPFSEPGISHEPEEVQPLVGSWLTRGGAGVELGSMKIVLLVLLLASYPMQRSVCAAEAGRRHAENDLQTQPAVRVRVGLRDAEINGADNRALQAAVDYVANLGGGTVEMGPGTYLMRDSLHLRSRVVVRGAGPSTILRKDIEHRSLLAADGDFGEAAITVADPSGFEIGRGVYVGSRTQRGFLGVCATLLNARSNYFTLSRSMNADIMVADGGFAATAFPVISGYDLEDAQVLDLAVDGNKAENPTRVDGCRAAGIFLYRGDHCVIRDCVVRDYNGDGIGFQQSNDVRVEGCAVEDCAGLGLHPGSGSQRPVVKGCRVVGNGDDGLFFCWRVRGGLAEDNRLENNGGHGVSIGHKDSDNCIRRNTIVGNKRGGVFWRAETEPMAAHRNTFENNTVRDNDGWGLFIDGATDGTVIRGNTIEDTGAGRQQTAIRIGKRAGAVTLEDNRIRAETPLLDERPGK